MVFILVITYQYISRHFHFVISWINIYSSIILETEIISYRKEFITAAVVFKRLLLIAVSLLLLLPIISSEGTNPNSIPFWMQVLILSCDRDGRVCFLRLFTGLYSWQLAARRETGLVSNYTLFPSVLCQGPCHHQFQMWKNLSIWKLILHKQVNVISYNCFQAWHGTIYTYACV